MVFTPEQDAFILMAHFRSGNRNADGTWTYSSQSCIQQFQEQFPEEEKRAQVEKKIEEHEIREKQEIKKERQELFLNRKKKQAEIKMIELKMNRMKEYTLWEERQKPRMNFIHTKAKPHIHYLPRRLNVANKALLENCKSEIEKLIETKKQEVYTELQHIEDRMKKNFEPKKYKEDKSKDEEGHEKTEDQDETIAHPNEAKTEENGTTANGNTDSLMSHDFNELGDNNNEEKFESGQNDLYSQEGFETATNPEDDNLNTEPTAESTCDVNEQSEPNCSTNKQNKVSEDI